MNDEKPKLDNKERGYAALFELETLRVATMSQSSHWPRITVQIQMGAKDERRVVEFGVNGRRYEFLRGVKLPIPPEVVDNLNVAHYGVLQEIPLDGGGNRHETTDVPRFPYFIVDGASQERYELWQNAKSCRTYMHTHPPKDDGSLDATARISTWKAECEKTRDHDMALAIQIVDRIKEIKQREDEDKVRLKQAAAA